MKKLICLLCTGVFLLFTECSKDPLDFAPDIPAEKGVVGIEALSPEVDAAVETGVAWLLTQRNPSDGSFGGSFAYDAVARTALAVTKLCDRSVEMGYPYPAEDGPYVDEIVEGLNYIYQYAVNATGGIYLSTNSGHSVYNTGIAMMAIAAARCPACVVEGPGLLSGKTFEEVLQVTVDFFTNSQNPDGGWRYWDDLQPSDNSNTGFAVLGLLAAEGAGIPIDQSLKDNLSVYIDYIQYDANGGSGYVVPNSWVNILKTGNLLFEMAFVGDTPESARANLALEYIGNTWNAPSGTGTTTPGWKPDNYLAMYCLMKGFVTMDIETIIVGSTEVDWYNEFVVAILGDPANTNPWPLPGSPWLDPYLSTVFSLLTLEKITPIPYIPVYVDVKPTSCPNPLNRKSKGVVPVAILGTADFDVTTIDPATVNISEVFALKWAYEDVATPYEDGFSDPLSKMDCGTGGADGYTDLVLHFDSQEIATLFAANLKDDLVVVELGGQLKDDGPSIVGEDVMIIVK